MIRVLARMGVARVDGKDYRLVNPWVVTCSVMLATFMEILDTTVVNFVDRQSAGSD